MTLELVYICVCPIDIHIMRSNLMKKKLHSKLNRRNSILKW